MRNDTRKLFTGLLTQVAAINGVEDATVQFSVAPTVEQKLEEVIQNSSDFLKRINVIPVRAQEGAKVGVGVTRPIASRTATNSATGKRRRPVDPTQTADRGRYRCEQTNSDTAIKYAKLDMWAHRPEFQTLYRDTIVKQQGRDRIMIAFNGVDCAADTDHEAFPLLQDVNFGWLYKIRTYAPERVCDEGEITPAVRDGDGDIVTPGKVYVGLGERGVEVDFVNLDALVDDAVEALDEWHRDDTDLVVIVGRSLVKQHFANFINEAGNTPTEVEARNRILTLPKQIGGKTAIMVPFFPADAILITRLDNLSIYVQSDTRRRQIKDAPEFDQVEDYQSVNESYVVEDYGQVSLVENIVMGKAPVADPGEE